MTTNHANAMTELTDNTFDEVVMGASLPVLVEFSARWCGPCQMLAPILGQLADDHAGQLVVAQIDVDDNPLTQQRFRVMSMPTLVLLVDGRECKRMVGARGKAHLVQELAEYLEPAVSAR